MSDSSSKSRIALALAAVLGGVLAFVLWNKSGEPAEGEVDASAEAEGTSEGASKRKRERKRARAPSGAALRGADKGVISGTISDASGKGIGGARVCGTPRESDLQGAGEPHPRCTTSEADGHYRLADLWPVKTSVSASAPGYKPERWGEEVDGAEEIWVRLQAGRERSGVDITLEPGGVAVRGVVKDISGGVIEGAQVSAGARWWFSGGALSTAWTDEEGRFELWVAPGEVRLKAHAEGYADTGVSSAAPTELAELYLTPESVISGTVIHAETKQPVAGVTVSVDAGFFNEGGGAAMSDSEGRFRIAGVAPGSYALSLRADEFYGESAEKVHLGLAQSVEGLVVEAHPAFYVDGRVVLAGSEEPCTRGRVVLTDAGERRFVGELDEEGHAFVRGLLPGEYEVEVRCARYVSEAEYEPVVIADVSRSDLVWEVSEGRAIRGIVVDGRGEPVARANVSARAKTKADDPRAQQTSAWSVETKEDGEFELAGLIAGSYELSVYAREHPRLDDKTAVELEGGADLEDVRIELPASGVITGIVRDDQGQPVTGVEVDARRSEGRWSSRDAVTGDDGRFEISGLAVGPTRVTARQGWFETMRAPGTTDDDVQGELVEVVAEAPVEVELVVESHTQTIRGRVVDSTGAPLGDAFVDATRMSDRAGANAQVGNSSLRWGWDRQPVLSDQDGSFELGELSAGDYIVHAYRKGGGEAIVEGVAAGSSGVELVVVDTGEILGEVVLAGGGVPERFEVSASDRKQGLWRSDSFFRTGGRFVLRELPAGSYELSVSAVEGAATSEVSLEAGASVSDVRIELTPKVTVRGRLIDSETSAPISGMKVTIQAAGGVIRFMGQGKGGEEISDAEGRFVVADAEAGQVSMMIMPRNWSEDNDYGWTNRSLVLPTEPATQDLGDVELIAKRLGPKERPGDLGYTLEDPEPDAEPEERRFVVALIRPGGPAEGSGLEVGDVIVEVDGKAVSGLDSHRYDSLTQAPPGTELTLSVDGGKSVKIVLGAPRN